jgi:hypothetical protein
MMFHILAAIPGQRSYVLGLLDQEPLGLRLGFPDVPPLASKTALCSLKLS